MFRVLYVLLAFLVIRAEVTAQTLTASQAKSHEGEKSTVCGRVASERTATSSRGEPTSAEASGTLQFL